MVKIFSLKKELREKRVPLEKAALFLMVKIFSLKKFSNSRVRSWLRMNAGGVLNTCKSNGVMLKPSDT